MEEIVHLLYEICSCNSVDVNIHLSLACKQHDWSV